MYIFSVIDTDSLICMITETVPMTNKVSSLDEANGWYTCMCGYFHSLSYAHLFVSRLA